MTRRNRSGVRAFSLLAAAALAAAVVVAGCTGGGKGSFSDPLDHLLVTPDGATIDSTTGIQVRATGVTAKGRHVDLTGVTWTPSAGTVDAQSIFTPSAAGDVTLTATAEGKTGTGTIHVIATGTLDVTVVDAATGAGIQAATVALVTSASTVSVTAASGSATLTGSFSGKISVHATATNYVPMTLYDVSAKKIRIPMRPVTPAAPGSFRGSIDFTTAYNRNDPPTGSLWVGIAGPSLHGNILAFGLNSLLGANRDVSIGGLHVNAPSNVFVYGATADYVATAPAGATAAWALGGPVEISAITSIIGGGGSDLGAVVTQLLPVFNNFYYALKDGLTVTSNQDLSGQDLVLDTKLAHITSLDVPPRPVTDPNPLVVGAIDLGATEGFVPAGLTVVQGSNAVAAEVHMPALSGQFADKSYLFLTVAQDGGLGGSGSGNQQVATLTRGITGQSSVSMPEYLVPPALSGFQANGLTRVVAFPVTPNAQLTLQTFARTVVMGTGTNAVSTVYEWDVATAGDSTGFTLPMMSGTNGAQTGGAWTVQSLGLESQTWDGVLTPGASVDLSSYFNDANRIVISHATVQ